MRRWVGLALGLLFLGAPAWAEATTPVRVVVLSIERSERLDVDERLEGRLEKDVARSLANSPYKRVRVLRDAKLRMDPGDEATVPIRLADGEAKLSIELLEVGDRKTKMRLRCPKISNLNTETSHANGGTLLLAVPNKNRAVAIVPN